MKDGVATAAEAVPAADAGRPEWPADHAAAEGLARLPAEFIDSLSHEQRIMLGNAMPGRAWGQHPVDLRFTVPLLGRGFFVTLVAGMEKRGQRRRRTDRTRYPLHRAGNLLFLLAVAALLYALVLTGIILARDLPLG